MLPLTELSQLGRINIICGRNASGKSTLLQTIHAGNRVVGVDGRRKIRASVQPVRVRDRPPTERPGDPTATERVFVNPEGVRRACKFNPSDTRVLEEQALDRQLLVAAFLPKIPGPDPSMLSL